MKRYDKEQDKKIGLGPRWKDGIRTKLSRLDWDQDEKIGLGL